MLAVLDKSAVHLQMAIAITIAMLFIVIEKVFDFLTDSVVWIVITVGKVAIPKLFPMSVLGSVFLRAHPCKPSHSDMSHESHLIILCT